jgi:hypothetical protein
MVEELAKAAVELSIKLSERLRNVSERMGLLVF